MNGTDGELDIWDLTFFLSNKSIFCVNKWWKLAKVQGGEIFEELSLSKNIKFSSNFSISCILKKKVWWLTIPRFNFCTASSRLISAELSKRRSRKRAVYPWKGDEARGERRGPESSVYSVTRTEPAASVRHRSGVDSEKSSSSIREFQSLFSSRNSCQPSLSLPKHWIYI